MDPFRAQAAGVSYAWMYARVQVGERSLDTAFFDPDYVRCEGSLGELRRHIKLLEKMENLQNFFKNRFSIKEFKNKNH